MRKTNSFIYRVEERIIPWFSSLLPDDLYLKWLFRHRLGYRLNLKDPKSYNEKLQWLKLNDRHEEYTDLVDKVAVKSFVSEKIGPQYIIPTYGVWDTVEEIDWGSLPSRFVVKSTNDSGGVVVCKDKASLDFEKAKALLKKRGGRDYTKLNKEYPYHNVKHRFLAEEYEEDESGTELKDYKFFCFDGKPLFLFVATGRQKGDTRFDFFDINFNHLPVINGHPNADIMPTQPDNYDEMVRVASALSEGIPHVRVDLYNVKGKVLFGEMTFYHWSGIVPFEPIEWDYKFGSYLNLPKPNTMINSNK